MATVKPKKPLFGKIMSVFVTVGSTSFDELVKTVSSPCVLQLLEERGFEAVTFQIGKGTVIPEATSDTIKIEWFRYKDSIVEDIKNASLVIGHGGAGTILETLIERKELITVINDSLMNNHQMELARQFAEEGYLRYCSCGNLLETLREHFESTPLKLYQSQTEKFALFLENVMGVP